jgi:hypothetical protein
MPLLNLDAIEQAPFQRDPFEFFVAKGAVRTDALAELNKDYPVIEKPANYAPDNLTYGPSFARLLKELGGPAFEACLSRKFGVDLHGARKTVTVRKFSELSDGNIHTDHWSKLVTVLVYFNPEWTREEGQIRFLRSATDIDDYAVQIPPLAGTIAAFRRSNRSFHGYKRFQGERRMLQMSWVRSNHLAWLAQQLARTGTHTGKKILRLVSGRAPTASG